MRIPAEKITHHRVPGKAKTRNEDGNGPIKGNSGREESGQSRSREQKGGRVCSKKYYSK